MINNGDNKNNKNNNENNGRICVIPGTFDPVTNGHVDVIFRASQLFDEVYVISMENSAKKTNTMFDSEERLKMLTLACADIDNNNPKKINVNATSGLLVDYAKSKNARFIVKGIRNSSDYEYEYSMFLINREIGNNIETLFLPAKSEYLYMSSAFVREMIKYNRDISKYVPEKVNEFIVSKFQKFQKF